MDQNGTTNFSVDEGDIELDEDDEFEYLAIPDEDFLDETDTDRNLVLNRIPFSKIHEPPLPFDSDKLKCFLPGQKINVQITDIEHAEGGIFNPNIYVIVVNHGEFTWTIRRRYRHFRALHDSLVILRAKSKIPVPMQRSKERRKSIAVRKQKVPKFPNTPEPLIQTENLDKRKQQLQDYLQAILRFSFYRNHHDTLEFLEVSPLSFVFGLGPKRREGMIQKRAGGRRIKLTTCGCFPVCHCTATWNTRWLVLKDTFVAYVNPSNGIIGDVLLMDRGFEVQCGLMTTGVSHGLLITNLSRHLLMQCETRRVSEEWQDDITTALNTTGKEFRQVNRFSSFAPIRQNTFAQWFVDGANYMAAVADAMEGAKEEIFITDWWLSPELYLKRPVTEGEKWRLDIVLKRKAEQGVRVFILIYKELEMALGLNSFYTKQTLVKMHPGIKVLRHPDGITLWSHHEKMVVIDQRIAFLGGVDLCYGRWDTSAHRLTDVGTQTMAHTFTEPPALDVIVEDSEDDSIMEQMGLAVEKHGRNRLSSNTESVNEGEENLPPQRRANNMNTKVPKSVRYDDDETATIRETNSSDRQSSKMKDNRGSYQEQSRPAQTAREINANHVANSDNVDETSRKGRQVVVAKDGAYWKLYDTEDMEDVRIYDVPRAWRDKAQRSSEKSRHENQNNNAKTSAGEDSKVLDKGAAKDDYGATGTSSTSPTLPFGAYLNDISRQATVDTVDSGPKQERRESSANFLGRLLQRQGSQDERDKDKEDHERYVNFVMKQRGNHPPQKRPPLLHFKMKYFGRDSTFDSDEDDDRQVSPSPRSGYPTPATSSDHLINQQRKPDVGPVTPVTEAEKPSTPKTNKIKMKAYQLKEQFRRSKQISMDVTDDTVPMPSRQKMEAHAGHRMLDPHEYLEQQGEDEDIKLWIGKDYVNFIHKDFVDLDKPFTDMINRNETPRMPWHDIACVVAGKAARDVARHFIQRWNYTKLQKQKMNHDYPMILPRSYGKVSLPQWIINESYSTNCQMVRSATEWSVGIQHVECSIQQAYVELIVNAKHFIYIENQFFVTVMDDPLIENQISRALYERIVEAHRKQQPFRVYVVMPLLPAFEGELGTTTGTSIQAVTHYNYASICRGEKSLLAQLTKVVNDPFEYISFFGLRTHDILGDRLVSELVYVHSKLMIVDDMSVIIGSANINDRSLIGKRDSEIAMVIQDTRTVPTKLNGKPYQAGIFGSSLRQKIFREHLGLPPDADVSDPVSTSFYKGTWLRQASVNTSVYEQVFNCIPSDKIHSYQELRNIQKEATLAQTNPEEARVLLEKVKGHLVLMPLLFLSHENLGALAGTKEGLMPNSIWT